MKFLVTHRKAVLALIDKHGLEQTDFTYVKKRGRIHVAHNPTKKHFHYIRKVEVEINADKQFEKQTSYKYANSERNQEAVGSWEKVLDEIDGWLASLV